MIRSQEPSGWRRSTCTRTPVLSAERVEVSAARSSNLTVGSGVLDSELHPCIGHLLVDGLVGLPPGHRLVGGVGRRRPAARPGPPPPAHRRRSSLGHQPRHILGPHRLRLAAHLQLRPAPVPWNDAQLDNGLQERSISAKETWAISGPYRKRPTAWSTNMPKPRRTPD